MDLFKKALILTLIVSGLAIASTAIAQENEVNQVAPVPNDGEYYGPLDYAHKDDPIPIIEGAPQQDGWNNPVNRVAPVPDDGEYYGPIDGGP